MLSVVKIGKKKKHFTIHATTNIIVFIEVTVLSPVMW